MLDTLRREAALRAIQDLDYFRTLEWHETIDSTNRYLARQLKQSSIPLPALIVADQQSAGEGRGANRWWSPNGCLMFSMAIAWPHAAAPLAMLPLRVGLGLAECLASLTRSRPSVKWPNDVYVADRKVAGILIESVQSSSAASGHLTIVGIGVNCQVDWTGAPEEVRQRATSLHEHALQPHSESTSPTTVLVAWLQHWRELEARQETDAHWLEKAWPQWSWLEGKRVEVTSPEGIVVGTAEGIDGRGALQVVDGAGRKRSILSGTVRCLGEAFLGKLEV
jgi:BirA family biotin operon repressor/biotin-[acetyl-CoA-carboxylase] ligase